MDRYPIYPTPQPANPQTGAMPKHTSENLTKFYDILVGVGLNPLPKDRIRKSPISDLWQGSKRTPTGRDEALSLQALPKSSGWFIVPSLEKLNLVIIDLDDADLRNAGHDPEIVYDRIQAMSTTRFVIYTPANGVHLFYVMSDEQLPPNNIHPRADYPGIELRTRSIGTGVATLGSFARYENGKKKGVVDNHQGEYTTAPYGEYDHIPQISDRLLEWLREGDKPVQLAGEEWGETVTGGRLINAFQTSDAQVGTVIEALNYALKDWGNDDYAKWLQLWMSAHHASSGSLEVCEHIIAHENVRWSDGKKGQNKFRRDWESHQYQERGYTIASLFYLATKNGWMQTSAVDIEAAEFDIVFETERVSDWITSLDEVPDHVALLSQTGSGKTYGIKALWERLGKPRTVIFVPSIKLAFDMKNTLVELGIPAEAYRHDETMETKTSKELIAAQVLVTTLQTFTRKMFVEGVGYMKSFGLVYIEECDQLFQQFAKALGEGASHVTQEQSELGFKVIKEAFEDAGKVWGVDATMTNVTLAVFDTLSDRSVAACNNYTTNKPAVVFLETKLEAYTKVYNALMQGSTVVVACDTKNEAETLVDTMIRLGVVTNESSIAITGDSGRSDDRVLSFARNSNVEAARYKLVAYNSAMASGVSVTSVRPDVVVQIASGWLTPRIQLQILNRYRKQNEVFCFYQQRRELPAARTEDQIVEEAKNRTLIEADWVNLPVIERSDLSNLRDFIRALSITDEMAQRRNPVWFYKRLLKDDGRNVVDSASKIAIARVEAAYEDAKEARDAMREDLASTWKQVPPARERKDMPATYDDMDVRRAYTHQWLLDVIGSIPEDEKPAYIYEVTRRLYKRSKSLSAFVLQHKAIQTVERAIADRERSYLSQSQAVSRSVLAALLRYLFITPDERLTPELLLGRSGVFLRVVQDNERLYNAVIKNPDKSISAITERVGGDPLKVTLALARNIGSTIGVKVRTRRTEAGKEFHIANLEEINDFLRWKYRDVVFELSSKIIEDERFRRKDVYRQLSTLPTEKLEYIMSKVAKDVAVEVAIMGKKL